jgi:hypothetical protein
MLVHDAGVRRQKPQEGLERALELTNADIGSHGSHIVSGDGDSLAEGDDVLVRSTRIHVRVTGVDSGVIGGIVGAPRRGVDIVEVHVDVEPLW